MGRLVRYRSAIDSGSPSDGLTTDYLYRFLRGEVKTHTRFVLIVVDELTLDPGLAYKV